MADFANTIATLGFDQNEVRTYLFLLEQGALSVGTLAKRMGLPRTTLYTVLARLRESGLVSELPRQSTKIFAAEPPDAISALFHQRVTELESQQRKFIEQLPQLRKKHRAVAAGPRMAVFEGGNGIENVLKDMLRYSDTETLAVWPIKKMIEALSPDFFNFHNRERIRHKLYTRAIWPQKETIAVKDHPYLGWGPEFQREIRVAPAHIHYSLGYWIYANKIAFLSPTEEGYGFIIESQALVDTLKPQFELLWNISKPLSFDKKHVREFLKDLE